MSATSDRPPRHPSRRSREQGGYVLPLFAILLTVLMAIAGFGVDVWNWWYSAQRVQRAADAGALAGVIFMPGDSTSATATAREAVSANGYPSSAVLAEVGDRPNRLRVQVTENVSNSFVSLLGIRTTTIRRDATAEYSGVVETGSPINQMGGQPGPSDWAGATSAEEATNPQVWAQIAGPGNFKGNGDRYTSSNCDGANYACSGGNTEYRADGYYYTVRINATASDISNGFLLIDVYDPAFVQSGDNCTEFRSSNDGQLRTDMANLGDRYNTNSSSLNNEYCTGDHRIQDVSYGSGYPTVMFRTARPDATPWNVRDNFSTGTVAACDGTDATHGAYGTNVTNRFRPYGSSGGENADNFFTNLNPSGNTYLRAVYHQFVRVCAVRLSGASGLGISTPGEYDVSFNSQIVGAGSGHNRYAIRAGIGTSATATTADGARVSVFANGPMPLYQNATSSTAAFYMARVLPGSNGRILRLELFDVGDGSGSGTITVLPPADSGLSAFTGCSATLTGGGTPDITSSQCRLNNVSSGAGYNGQAVTIFVPIPNGYTCGSGSPRVIGSTDCWVRVRFNWSSNVQDTTTWQASILGDPVRLTE